MPNDAINAEDIRKNADWLEAAFRKRGFVTKQLENNGKPLVFAEFAPKSANAKTILFYMHFDGQPVIPGAVGAEEPVDRGRQASQRERPMGGHRAGATAAARRSTRTGGFLPAPRPTTRGRS